MAAAQQLLHLQWRAAVLPVNLLLSWTQYLTGALVHALMACGLYREGKYSQTQYREALASVDHFSRREDAFRKHVTELEGEVERLQRDRRKALVKLQRARAEQSGDGKGLDADEVAPEAEDVLTEIPRGVWLHASFAACSLAILWFWCQPEAPSVSRKFSSVAFFPVVVTYVSGALLQQASQLGQSMRTGLHCGCWFLAGFIMSHWLLGHS